MTHEELIKKVAGAGLTIEEPAAPVGSYVPFLIQGDLAYLSGQISKKGSEVIRGKVGKDLTLETAQKAAQLAALNVVSIIDRLIGCERLERVLKVVGYVNVDPSFESIPQVINGASDFLVHCFGDRGRHVRSAVGCASLPLGAAVEIEATLLLKGVRN